jgi:hypothetical protein
MIVVNICLMKQYSLTNSFHVGCLEMMDSSTINQAPSSQVIISHRLPAMLQMVQP